MKIKPLLPGIYVAKSDDGLKSLGRIAYEPHKDADMPWTAEKRGFVGRFQHRARTLNEARAWMRR